MHNTVGIRTLARYLLGDREAIRTLASTRHTLWLGLLFVLSAGFAREYDGADLLHEPWHVVLPLGASLASSLVLFFLLYLPGEHRSERSGLLPATLVQRRVRPAEQQAVTVRVGLAVANEDNHTAARRCPVRQNSRLTSGR